MNKKLKVSLFALLAVCALTNCKKPTSGIFDVQSGVSQTYALPVAISSCVDDYSESKDSLGPGAADFSKLSYTWRGANPFEIKYIHVSLKGGNLVNGRFDVDIGGDELAIILATSPTPIPGVAAPELGHEYTSLCSVKVGGIKFADPTKPGTASGTITVFGLETDDKGQSTPVSADTQVSIHFDGKVQ